MIHTTTRPDQGTRRAPGPAIHTYRPPSRWPRLTRFGRALLFALAVLAGVASGQAWAETTDVKGAIYAAAQIHGVDPEPLIALVACESEFDPDAKGDHRWREGRFVPTSRGPAQISDLDTGLYAHFKLEYPGNERTDIEAVADYIARVYAGHFLPGRPAAPPLHPHGIVSIERWSCWWRR